MQQGKCQQLAKAFSVLGTEMKVRLLNEIIGDDFYEGDPVVPTLLAERMSIPVARVAYSLKRMHEAGILTRKETGKYTFYSVDPKFIELIKEFF